MTIKKYQVWMNNNNDGLEAIILTRSEVKLLKKFLLKSLNVTDKEYRTIYNIINSIEEIESKDCGIDD